MMILRAVTLSGAQLIPARLPYDLVERTVQHIMMECPSITRIFYDQTPTAVGKETFA
jgi:GMP synthase PP-ATPase subunit